MMDIVKLRTPNWGPLVCQGLYELYKEKIGFNVAIYGSDGGILDAHACILMAVSPTLKTWLAGDPIQGCHSVEIDSITCETWTTLLDFIYSGSVSVERVNVQVILEAAEKLQMQALTRICNEAIDSSSESDLPPLISTDAKSIVPNIVKRSIRSSITPIQPHQDAKAKQPGQISPPNDLPPLISQQPAKIDRISEPLQADVKERAMSKNMPQSTIADVPSKVPNPAEQPLDLSKDIANPSANQLSQLPPGMVGTNGMPDPQMQAVMAVYYNQMLQYSMLAQKMGGQFGQMPKLPNGGAMPMPNIMPPMMPQQAFMPAQDDTSVDGRQRKFPCSICGMLFFTRHVKEQHELTHTNLKPYGCSICGFRARQKAVIWRHKKNRHPEADSSVSMDSLTMLPPETEMPDTEDEDNEAMETTDEPQDDDEDVSLTMALHEKVDSSAKSNGTPESMDMAHTEASAQDQATMLSAGMIMSSDPEKPFMCATCGRGFKNKYILSQHQMIHSNERRYACDICGFRAKQMSVIYNHKRNKHCNNKPGVPSMFYPFDEQQMPKSPSAYNGDNPKAMSTPGRDGGSMTDIEEEVRNAPRTEDGYLCKICDRSLKSKIILQEHIMTHYNVRRYPCCYCNYRAKQRAGLYNHMKVKHKGLKPIWPSKSKRPPFNFPGSPSVKERLNRSFQERQKTNVFHVGLVRKHMCRTCGKTFRMKNTLEKHELIHMNIKRYSCRYCGYKAKLKPTIERHITEHHPEMKVKIFDLYSNRSMSPVPFEVVSERKDDNSCESVPEVEDLSHKPLTAIQTRVPKPMNGIAESESMPTDLRVPSIPKPQLLSSTMTPPPQITREPGERAPRTALVPGHQPHRPEQMMASQNGGVTMLNGSVGILQLELPKSQREALESPNTNFSSYGTPDKPHRCKTCGRCFRLRHVMEQHELTHFNFRKYMCDICGFRAKQKAVIYRHKKVKHPNHPGAGRVTLVPEYGLPYGRPIPMPPSSLPQVSLGLPMQAMMKPIAQPATMTPSPLVVVPTPQVKLSPSNNPELSHNNNKSSPQDANQAQDLSMTRKRERDEPIDMKVNPFETKFNPMDMKMNSMDIKMHHMDMKINPMDMQMNTMGIKMNPMEMKMNPMDLKISPTGAFTRSPIAKPAWYTAPGNNDQPDSGDDDDSLKSSENITNNLAMGLPSMVPTSQNFMPMIAPLSPESNSASPNNTQSKKYSCQVCGRSFKHRHVLEQHYITHTGLRPYKCEFCDFCARQKASLWRHKQKHLHQQM